MKATRLGRNGFGAGFVTGAALAAGGAVVICSSAIVNVDAWKHHPAIKRYGAPETSKIRFLSNFVSEFDYKTRTPRWVQEHLSSEQDSRVSRKGIHYREDDQIEEDFRALLSHYRRSGYDRGHMAPAANNKESDTSMRESFLLGTNTAPQVGAGFNQDYWARFEQFIRQLKKDCSDVYIITGPLFLPTKKTDSAWQAGWSFLGTAPKLMSVPTHYFKVVLADTKPSSSGNKNEKHIIGAFVMPNAQIHPRTPLSSFVVPLSLLEQASGIRVFPKFFGRNRLDLKDAVDAISLEWQNSGQKLEGHHTSLLLQVRNESEQEEKSSLPIVQQPGSLRTEIEAHRQTARKYSVQHICDYNKCRLPRERFWEPEQPTSRKQ